MALALSGGWVVLALLFNGGIYWFLGAQPALEFFTGYLVEKALSIDNLLVILLIFTNFQVPARYQHNILFCGILGALFFRLTLILAGLSLISHVHWMTYVLGGFLCLTALKMLEEAFSKVKKTPWFLRFFFKNTPLKWGRDGQKLLSFHHGKWQLTPFLATLLAVEGADLIFALDSIPAIFAISHDPLIVYTSNAFAILGLRELYFVIAEGLNKLSCLPVGLAAILLFVGIKMLFESFFAFPLLLSLGVILLILAITAFCSWRLQKQAS